MINGNMKVYLTEEFLAVGLNLKNESKEYLGKKKKGTAKISNPFIFLW